MNVDELDPHHPAWDALWTLFAGYFHQDFDAEYDDWLSAIHAYRSGNSPSVVVRAIEQLEILLKTLGGEEEIEQAIRKLGLDYCPDIG